MSLYWYARVAHGMPLLQFLAFYQVIEFFFPMFSEAEAIERVKICLKDPKFDAHNDSDLIRLVKMIRPSSRGYGDERSQLAATIKGCTNPKDLRAFIGADKDRATFFESQYKIVAKAPIPLKNPSADLLPETAQRLYEIRCKIVHTKEAADDLEIAPLLPFTREAEHLHFDIELIQFIATNVLIKASQSLKI